MPVSSPIHPAPAPHDGANGSFYASLPVFDSFEKLTDPAIYAPLPAGWVVGMADIVRSTQAIAEGGYKVVNTIAASLIVSLSNALKDRDFPFTFGGDGANFALSPDRREGAERALAQVAGWARDEFGLELRVALVSIDELRRRGRDVRVARFGPSPHVSYAMFTGGGLAHAEKLMKAGEFALAPAPPGARPDLTGLSCRFEEIGARRGLILSLIAVPAGPEGEAKAYNDLILRVLRLAGEAEDAGRPVPEGGPALERPFAGFSIERKALGGESPLGAALLAARRLFAHAVFKVGRPVGGFDPAAYRRQLVENADFRKFDDGLRMTLDCSEELADRIEAVLEEGARAGALRYGLHRQEAALITCYVPSPTQADHIHFVDGAKGGYAMAARALKG